MINVEMQNINYYLYSNINEYGQAVLTDEVQGSVRIAIYLTSKAIQDNINYTNASYIGLTKDNITDKYVLEYNGEKLKVLYVYPKGRYKQVFLGAI